MKIKYSLCYHEFLSAPENIQDVFPDKLHDFQVETTYIFPFELYRDHLAKMYFDNYSWLY